MFKTLRWRLTIWFVTLSLLVYASVAALAMAFFHAGLTNALDDELQELTRELMPTVDYDGTSLQLHTWPVYSHRHSPIKMLASVELFDKHAHLVQEYGTHGLNTLLRGTKELTGGDYAKRSMSTPIISDGKLIGYLQIQLTTKLRDHAMQQFAFTMAMVAPVLLLALGVVGYFFAGKAAQPIEDTFSVLRQFISDAGHELQTPLAVISAAAENLSVQLEETPHAQRLHIISRNTDRMAKLVRDLMLLAKVDSPSVAESKARANIAIDKLVKQCAEEFEDRYHEKNITLMQSDIQTATVLGDQDALQRVMINLLENALRYTDAGGSVTVSCKNFGKLVRVSVEDTGVGIPPDSLPRLFDRFYRVDKSRSRAAGGFGLGLAIVKAIADSHRGWVEVASEVGKGSRFTIVLPAISS